MSAQTHSIRDSEPLRRRTRRAPKGVSREDSDDELGSDDLPWEWIYDAPPPERNGEDDNGASERKRRKVSSNSIVGARMGSFECRVGDCVLLKAEGSNEAWVGIICEFINGEDDEDDMTANFMWFSTEAEIRNKDKKRTDFCWVTRDLSTGFSLARQANHILTRRTSSTLLLPGMSTPWPRSMARPRSPPSMLSFASTPRARSHANPPITARHLSAVVAATPGQPHIPTSSSGKRCSSKEATSSNWLSW